MMEFFNRTQRRWLGFFYFCFLMLITVPSYAKPAIQSNFTGTLSATLPDGKVILVEPGEKIPEISPGSTIEVFNGQFSIDAEEQDHIKLACLNHHMSLLGLQFTEAKVSLRCEECSGRLKVIKGSVKLIDSDGKEWMIQEGKEYGIYGCGEKAPPTEEGTPSGGAAARGDLAKEPPVDSRNIETSAFR